LKCRFKGGAEVAHELNRAKVTLRNEKGQALQAELGERISQPGDNELTGNLPSLYCDITKRITPVEVGPDNPTDKLSRMNLPNRGAIARGGETPSVICHPLVNLIRGLEDEH
jgi:hypothetical protein